MATHEVMTSLRRGCHPKLEPWDRGVHGRLSGRQVPTLSSLHPRAHRSEALALVPDSGLVWTLHQSSCGLIRCSFAKRRRANILWLPAGHTCSSFPNCAIMHIRGTSVDSLGGVFHMTRTVISTHCFSSTLISLQ